MEVPGSKPLERGYIVYPNGNIWSCKSQKFLKTYRNKWGYVYVDLSVCGIKKRVFVHRAVAEAFIPNPNCYPQVNHKDEDKTNNCMDNLEWCTAKYNNSYGSLNAQKADKFGKPVTCVETGVTFKTMVEAETATGARNISQVCKGKYKTSGGYHWKLAEVV